MSRSRIQALLASTILGLAAAGFMSIQRAEEKPASTPRWVEIGPARNLSATMLVEAAERSKGIAEPWRDPRRVPHGVMPAEAPPASPLKVPGDTQPGVEVMVKRPAPPEMATSFLYQPRLARSFTAHDRDGIPADPMIAAGPTHLVAVVNTQIAFYTKDGVEVSDIDLNTFFGLGPTNSFDPKVVYDESSQRFFVMMISRQDAPTRQGFFHFGLSQTSDPTQGWWIYGPQRNDLDGEWVDYPHLGVGSRGLYFTGALISFPWPAPAVDHDRSLWILGKTNLLSGGPTGIWIFNDLVGIDPIDGVGSLAPTVTYGAPPGGVDAFVTTWESTATSSINHLVYGVTLPPTFPSASPSLLVRSVSQTFPGGIPNVPQLGGPALVKAGNVGAPPMNAVYQNGKLITIYHWPGGGGMQLQPLECDVSAWPSLGACTGFFLQDSSRFLFWPAIAVNHHGDALVGSAASSASEFVSARWAHRFEDQNLFGPTRLLRAGDAYYGTASDTAATVYNWGDYSGADVDPLDHGFWIFNMYAAPRIGGQPIWGSWIGYVPRAVFIDRAYAGIESGSPSRPWNTVAEGVNDALSGNDLVIKAGSYPGAVTISKRLEIIADGGPVTIGQ